MATGYLVDVKHVSTKEDSFYELCVRNENGYEIIRDTMPFVFWMDARVEEEEISRNMRIPFDVVEKFLPWGREDLYEFFLDDHHQRSTVRKIIKEISSKTYGIDRSISNDYILRKFPPYALLDYGEKIERIATDESFRPETMAFDIETDNRGGVFPMPEEAIRPIILISCADKDGSRLFSIHDGGEKRMIEEFFHYIIGKDPDFIVGWNSDNYDWPYIVRRAEKLGVPATIGRNGQKMKKERGGQSKDGPNFFYSAFGRQFIDLYKFLPKIYTMPNRGLDDITLIVLGREPVRKDKSTIYRYMDSRDAETEEYSRRDSIDLFDISTAIGFDDGIVALSKMLRAFPEKITRQHPSRVLNNYIQRIAYRTGGIVYGQPNYMLSTEQENEVASKKGIYPGACMIDRRVAYPEIFVRHEKELKKSFKAPVLWAADNILKSIRANRNGGKFSKQSTIASFLKSLAAELPAMVCDDQYPWRSRYLKNIIKKDIDNRCEGLYSDKNYIFAETPPERINNIPISEFDLDSIDSMLVTSKGYVYKKDGIVYANGISLRDKSKFVQDALNDIALTLLPGNNAEAVRKFEHYYKFAETREGTKELMENSKPQKTKRKKYSQKQLFFKEIMSDETLSYNHRDTPAYDESFTRRKLDALLNKSAKLFEACGLGENDLIAIARKNPDQQELEFAYSK